MPKNKDTLLQMLSGGLNKGLEMGSSGAQQSMKSQAEMEKQSAQLEAEKPYKDSEVQYKNRMAGVAEQQANTMEEYRKDQIRIDKLKQLFGGAGGDKALSGDAQKTSNMIDTARQSLNGTEELLKKHPIAGVVEKVTPNFVANLFGGPLKAVNDSKNQTKEALQAVYTGAAASGEQVPAFQSFSGPGISDILQGNVEQGDSARDAMNTLQQGYTKQKRVMSPEMLKAAGLENDPVAQQAMQQQEASQMAEQQKKLSRLKPEDQQAFQWLQLNPTDPASAGIKLKLQRRYGNLF